MAAGVELGEGLSSRVELVGVLLCRLAMVYVGDIGKGSGVCQSCYTFDMGDGRLFSLIKGGLVVAKVNRSLLGYNGRVGWVFGLVPFMCG